MFLLLGHLQVVALLFACVDREVTRSLIGWWKPQTISGMLICREENLENYVKASIHLNDGTAHVCGLVSSDLNVFVVALSDQTCEVRSCLWQPDCSRVESLRNLRRWMSNKGYTCRAVLDGSDDSHWSLSEYDA